MPSNLMGKYGPQYPELGQIDLNFKKNSASDEHHLSAKRYSPHELVDDKSPSTKEGNSDITESEHKNATKDHIKDEELAIGSRSLFDQMEDAVTKAKFIAAQQFLLQNFQKRSQVLMSAANTQESPISNEEKKKTLAPFPFSPFPFSLPPPPPMHQTFFNTSMISNVSNDALRNEAKSKSREIEIDTEDKDDIEPPKHAENALFLFSQIQNYRRHLLESGLAKFPIGPVDPNSVRQCDKLLAPF